MKNLRKAMGHGSYTTGGRGLTSYCLTDGRSPCTSEIHNLVLTNLKAHYGEPRHVDSESGTMAWFVEGIGIFYIRPFYDARYQFVELDKTGTEKDFVRRFES